MVPLQEVQVWSLVEELRSHVPCSMTKKTRKLTIHSIGFEQEKPSPWDIKGSNGRNCLSGQWTNQHWPDHLQECPGCPTQTLWAGSPRTQAEWLMVNIPALSGWSPWGGACPLVRLLWQVSSHDSGVERERVSQNSMVSNEAAASLSLHGCGSTGHQRLPCCRAEWKQVWDTGWNLCW